VVNPAYVDESASFSTRGLCCLSSPLSEMYQYDSITTVYSIISNGGLRHKVRSSLEMPLRDVY
jgi:hypothetical protein